MEKDNQKIKSIIESLLFVWGEPLSITKIAKVIGIQTALARQMISELQKDYEASGRGIQILEVDHQFQFHTLKENYEYVAALCAHSKSKGISNSALEALTVIAYRQPVTKADVDQIRGVNSESAIQSLLERGLIEVKGRLDKIGRPQVYGTTVLFLKCFGFRSLKDLPQLEGEGLLTLLDQMEGEQVND